MTKKVEAEHPMAGRSRRGRAKAPKKTEESKVAKSANLEGATAKMHELMSADAKNKAPVRNFDPSELSDLKDLVFLGRMSEEVEIAGFKFELTTLNNAEKRVVLKELAGKGKEMAAHVQTCTLAMSIQKINGVPLEEVYEDYRDEDDPEDMTDYQKCLKIVDEWQSMLVSRLFAEYERINQLAEGVFSDDPEGEDKLKK